jgi:hypothetical protein
MVISAQCTLSVGSADSSTHAAAEDWLKTLYCGHHTTTGQWLMGRRCRMM